MTDDQTDAGGDVDLTALLGPSDAVPGIDPSGVDAILEGVVDVDKPGDDADEPSPNLIPPDESEEADLSFTGLSETYPEIAEALQGEWGTGREFGANMEFARQAVMEFQTPELRAAFEESGVGDDPNFIRALASIGRRLAAVPGDPHSIKDTGRRDQMADNEEVIREKLDRLHALQHSPDIREQELYKKPKTQRALEQLYRSLPGGNEPVVGTGGRVV